MFITSTRKYICVRTFPKCTCKHTHTQMHIDICIQSILNINIQTLWTLHCATHLTVQLPPFWSYSLGLVLVAYSLLLLATLTLINVRHAGMLLANWISFSFCALHKMQMLFKFREYTKKGAHTHTHTHIHTNEEIQLQYKS